MRFMFERRNLAAWLIFLASLLLTMLVSWGLWQQNEAAAGKQFTLQAEGVIDDIDTRLRQHQQILLGGAGLFDASTHVSRNEWHVYIERLRLSEKYPGILGVGFSQLIQPAALKNHIAAIRSEGFREYTLLPPGKRDLYTAVVYLEPFTGRNLAAFGFDMFSEETRRKAMRYAVDNGRTAISGKVKLVQENQGKPQAGFLMYVPVYRKNMPVDTPEARWKALQGFVFSPYRMNDLMNGILGGVNATLDFAIYDGEASSAETQMYSSAEDHEAYLRFTPRFGLQRNIQLYGHSWTILLHSRPSFEAQFRSTFVLLVLLLGSGISTALFALTTSLNNRREKALQLAGKMTVQIRESEQRFKNILETSPTAARIAMSGGMRVMFSNLRYAELLNISPDQVEGVDPSQYYADRAVYDDIVSHIGRGEQVIDRLVELKIPGQGTKWTLASYYQVQYQGQTAVLGWFHDITDRMLAEIALQHERDFGNALFGSAGAVMLVLDRNGGIVRFNDAAEKVTGYQFAEIEGKPFWELFLLPEEQHEIKKNLQAGMIVPRYENSWYMRDGSSRLFDWSNAILNDAGGEVEYIVSVGIDITERKQAEVTLHEQVARTQAVLDSVIDGIITIDSLGKIASFNKAAEKIFGYSATDVVGKNVRMLMPEPHRTNHDGYLHNYMTTGIARIIGIGREVEGQRKDGSLFPMDLAISEISDQGKRMFIGLVRDITERKRIDRMKTEFVSTVSHELRTPLTAIRGSLGLIMGGVLGDLPEQVKNMLTIASNNTERLLMLINDILDMQKIEAGKMAFRFENVAIMPLLETAIGELASYGMQHKVDFAISHRIGDAHVFADRDRLMQVLSNLMSNAAKFSPPNSIVEISVARNSEGRLRISITDVGSGIPEDFKLRIFSPFSQSDSSDTRSKGGTGLGLAISKVIVERHGGIISFISREGMGSTFYIELPEMLGGSDHKTDQPRKLSASQKASVLIVEDDPDIAALIQRMLTEAGLNSDIAYSASQARQLLAESEEKYRLMTLDLQLPDEDGVSLLESLRRDAATRDLPVVVVSAQADDTKRQLIGGALGVMDWLQKPIDAARLIAVIKSATAESGSMPRVLHVEDDADVRTIVSSMLKGHCEMTSADSVASARAVLAKETFDLVLLDIGLTDGSGLDLIETIELRVTPPRIVIFSANEVSAEYADRVSAVLVKSRTGNDELLKILLQSMRNK